VSTRDDVLKALATVKDPEIHRPITELDMVGEVEISGTKATVEVLLTTTACPMRSTIIERVERAVLLVKGIDEVVVVMGAMTDEQRTALREKLRGPVPQIQFTLPESKTKVFAIASGKGGVGKSSLTANLAVAMAQRGFTVGVIDADIYGHSIPGILGLTEKATLIDAELRIPPQAHGVAALSMMAFKPGGSASPVAWRGPMLGKALEQFLTDFYWGDIDVLLIDMPPGTGDVAISLGQLLPNAEIIVITTPQSAAADVAIRAGMMSKTTRQRVVGVVENMGAISCPNCDCQIDLFGTGGGKTVADELSRALESDIKLLAQIPFDTELRNGGDIGQPLVLSNPDSPAAQAIYQLADTLMQRKQGLVGKLLKVFN
jgi:ATP-binding protein involved in chromosome partitioning